MMETNTDSLRKRILPILLFCQANKGDLNTYNTWRDCEDVRKKLFYAYYSGLFCRILYIIETSSLRRSFILDCNLLLDKYNWYDIQEADIVLFHTGDPYDCEVSDALKFLDGIDNVAWKDSGFGNGKDAVCIKTEHASWTFADVRGSNRRCS